MAFIPQKNPNQMGVATYSVAGNDFVATPNAGGKTVTITGLGFTFTVIHIQEAYFYNASDQRVDVPLVNLSVSGAIITFSDLDANLAGTEVFEVVIKGTQKAYDSINGTQNVEETNALNTKWISTIVLDLTNIATNTTGYGYICMDNQKYLGFQAITDGGTPTDVLTCTLEYTCQDDGTAMGSCAYTDCTEIVLGTGITSVVDADFSAILQLPLPVKYFRWKYVTSNDSGGDCDLTVYAKTLY